MSTIAAAAENVTGSVKEIILMSAQWIIIRSEEKYWFADTFLCFTT